MNEKINEIMKKEFIESKSPITLEKYVMSEVLSPVGDYINEFILGNELSEPVYRHMFQKILG